MKTFEEFYNIFGSRKEEEQPEEIEKTSVKEEIEKMGYTLDNFQDYQTLFNFNQKFKNKTIKLRDLKGNETDIFKVKKVWIKQQLNSSNDGISSYIYFDDQEIGVRWEIIIYGKRYYTKDDPYGEEDWIEE